MLRNVNSDINVPLALALVSFFAVQYFGIQIRGLGYLGKFVNVRRIYQGLQELAEGEVNSGFSNVFLGIIDFFVGILEILSELIRVVSFTFRLFGNMTAGEVLILSSLALLIPWVFPLPFSQSSSNSLSGLFRL